MAESISPKKPADDATDRPRDQVIRLDSEREQRRAGTVIDDGELETPVALEPAALEAPTKEPLPQPAPVIAAPPAPAKPKRSLTRPVLFALLPVALVVGGYFYVTGGQVMSTDNAYVQADIVGVSTDVSGTVDRDRRARQPGGEEGRRALPACGRPLRDRARRRRGAARHGAQPGADAAGELPAVAVRRSSRPRPTFPTYEVAFKRQQDLLKTARPPRRRTSTAPSTISIAARQKVQRRQGAGAGDAGPARRRRQPAGRAEPLLSAGAVGRRRRPARPRRHRRQGAVRRHRHQCRRAADRPAYLPASQPAFSLVSTDHLWIEAEPEGNRTDLCQARPDGDGHGRHLSGRRLERHGRQRSARPRRRASRCCRPRTPPATGSRSCSASRCG